MWSDPFECWRYGKAEMAEIKRRLPDAPIVGVVMFDLGDRCMLSYNVLPANPERRKLLAKAITGPIAPAPRPRWGAQPQRTH